MLIVNADDLGLSSGVNRGIFAAHERGIVTSASLMVRWESAVEAAAYARSHPSLSVGLHIDIGEWMYQNGEWVALYEVVPGDDPAMLEAEVQHQLETFRQLMHADPTHIDSHQHVHRSQPLASLLKAISRDLGIPLRHYAPHIRYEGGFYGQTGDGSPLPSQLAPDALIRLLMALPPGLTELGCHPGLGNDIVSMYRTERSTEVETLCDPRVREIIESEGIQLIGFADARDGQQPNS
jgi:predicted glycoside hydrolase/deacetylase ChbG (UPF0249 family)